MQQSSDRFDRALERLEREAFWLKTYQVALANLRIDSIGLDFFGVAHNALHDARLMRLIRILEDDSRVASIWYLRRSDQFAVDRAAREVGLDLERLAHMGKALKAIRDRVFVHIDKDDVFNPSRVYKLAGISAHEVSSACNDLHEFLKRLLEARTGSILQFDEYSGSDIATLASLRDHAEIRASSTDGNAYVEHRFPATTRDAEAKRQLPAFGDSHDFISRIEDQELLTRIGKCGVRDLPSYLLLEDRLVTSDRIQLAMMRLHANTDSMSMNNPCYVAKYLPGWVLLRSTDSFSLSFRSRSALKVLRVARVADLTLIPMGKLEKTPNLGKKSLQEICQTIVQLIDDGPEACPIVDSHNSQWVESSSSCVAFEDADCVANPINEETFVTELLKAIKRLPETHAAVLTRRMGFSGRPQTQAEIATALKLSSARISQLEKSAVKFLSNSSLWLRLKTELEIAIGGTDDPIDLPLLEARSPWLDGISEIPSSMRFCFHAFFHGDLELERTEMTNVVRRTS